MDTPYLIDYRFQHHSAHSGYDQIKHYLPHTTLSKIVPLFQNILTPFIKSFLLGSRTSGLYQKEQFLTELQVLLELFKKRKASTIFHFLYGEETYCYAGSLHRQKMNFLISTFHQPPDFFECGIKRRNHLKKLDAIITLSNKQREHFSRYLPKERIFYVPHGIDTNYFKPSFQEQNNDTQPSCLCVGFWLRDFKTLNETVKIVLNANKNIEIRVVINKENVSLIPSHSDRIKIYRDIPEQELLRLYQTSSVFLLPLKDCTANNALLEAMACGLPIVTTDVGGIRDYLDDKTAIIVPAGKAQSMAEATLAIIHDKKMKSALSQNVRRQAQQFSWPVVASKMQQIYSQLGH